MIDEMVIYRFEHVAGGLGRADVEIFVNLPAVGRQDGAIPFRSQGKCKISLTTGRRAGYDDELRNI